MSDAYLVAFVDKLMRPRYELKTVDMIEFRCDFVPE